MNWGRGLTLFIVGFIAAMLGMVYIAFQQSNEMLEDNYYDRELKYQEIIDAKSRLKPYLSELELVDSSDFIYLKLPPSIFEKVSDGNLAMLKLDNSSLDRNIPIPNIENKISKIDFVKGLYRIKLSWINNGRAYYFEDDIMIQ